MNQEYNKKIADLMLFGVNFQKGDKIFVSADYDCREMALTVAERAYKQGAAFVDIGLANQSLTAAAIEGTQEGFFFPEYLKMKLAETVEKGWKLISLRSGVEDDVLETCPKDRASAYFQAYGAVTKNRRMAVMNNKVPWTLTYVPSDLMVEKAFPDLPPEEGLKKYWDAIVKIMRLDLDDPVAFWRDKMQADKKRSELMQELDIDYLHFSGPGTDLQVAVNPHARWIGGFDKSQDGQAFMANIPTDEIFTTPDFRRVNGRVALTKPFVLHHNIGPLILDAWFEFKDGAVVDYGAAQGKETLDAFFAMDERNKYLGELALVDPQSPFAKVGITFFNGLYDENAACHLALGQAYPYTLKEPGDFSEEELQEKGFNTSQSHEDMMVGSEKVNVTAYMKDGKSKAIIQDGNFVI